MPAQQLPSIDALTNADALSEILGHLIQRVDVEPLHGVGFSNASHFRVTATSDDGAEKFVLKTTSLTSDWTAMRSAATRGREARLLAEPALGVLWDIIDCPYVAFAVSQDEAVAGLLMRDLSANLLPDVREPLTAPQEDALVGVLARMHARFWNHDVSQAPWLTRPEQYCDILSPAILGDPNAVAILSPPLRDAVPRGWTSSLPRLPSGVSKRLMCPGAVWARAWSDLPRTLLHGDVKVANFAIGADGRVSAFDWAMVGAGPCGIDLGWYLAVNASRLTGSKETTVAKYRSLLECERGADVDDEIWRRLEDVAAVVGARMLLWSKALALDAGRPGAQQEWDWWVDRLAAVPWPD
jgi:phosphotransferase family enzyme